MQLLIIGKVGKDVFNFAHSLKEDSHSGEPPDMVAHIKNWKNEHELQFPDRVLKPFVMTSEGDTILCTRFLKPIEPPGPLLGNGNRLYIKIQIVRYVFILNW